MTPEALWRRYSAIWSLNADAREPELFACLADDITYCDPNGPIEGRAALSYYMGRFQVSVPDGRFHIRWILPMIARLPIGRCTDPTEALFRPEPASARSPKMDAFGASQVSSIRRKRSPISARDRALEIAERVDAPGPLTASRFFAGAALIADGVQFSFVMKGSLYLRVDDRSRPVLRHWARRPSPMPADQKAVTVASYYEAPSEIVDDPDQLSRWAAEAHRAALAAREHSQPAKHRRLSAGVTP